MLSCCITLAAALVTSGIPRLTWVSVRNNPSAGCYIPSKDMLDLELGPFDLKGILASSLHPVLLDVREPWETAAASFPGALAMPMGDVPARAQELDPDGRIVVICHHGVRSLSVAHWLRNQGFEQAQSLQGGIDRWSRDIDPAVLRY